MKFSSLIIFSLMVFNSIAHSADKKAPCDVVKTIATRANPEARLYGTAFAIDSNHIIANDHSFYRDVEQTVMIVMEDGRMLPAEFINRDFHLNLAILTVNGANNQLKSCNIESSNQKEITDVDVFAYDDGIQLEYQSTKILTLTSGALLVPGISSSIEIDLKFNESMSGGVAFANGSVIGMLSQATEKNTTLLIPSDVISKDFRSKLFGVENRRYKLVPNEKKFKFKGFDLPYGVPREKIAPHEGRLPNFKFTPPHEGKPGGGGVHEGIITNPSVNEMYKIAISTSAKRRIREHVSINITDIHEMYQRQPKLTELLVASQSERIAVLSVDGITIENNLDFLRVMELCNSCKIDRFFVLGSRNERLADKYLELALKINNLSPLILALAQPAELESLRFAASTLVGLLTSIAEMRVRDPMIVRTFAFHWDKLNEYISNATYDKQLTATAYEIDLLIRQLSLTMESVKARGIL